MRSGPERVARGHWLVGGASLAFFVGDVTTGVNLSSEALELAEGLGKRALAANARILRGMMRRNAGHLAEGEAELEQAQREAEELGAGWLAFLAARFLSIAAMTSWDPVRGAAIAQAEMSAPRLAQAPLARWVMRSMAIHSLDMAGELVQARELKAEGRPVPGLAGWDERWLPEGEFERFDEEDDSDSFAPGAEYHNPRMFNRGVALDARDDVLAAEAHLEVHSAQAAAQGGHGVDALWWRPALAKQRARLRKTELARADLAVAEDIIGPQGHRGSWTPIRRARAEIAAADGDLATAEAELGLAIDNIREWGQGFLEPAVLKDWGRILVEHGQIERGIEKLDAAIEGFRRLGAGQPWVDSVLALRPV